MKKIVLIGSTGSIGKQLIDVVHRNSGDYKIVGLVANTRSDAFLKQCAALSPDVCALASEDKDAAIDIAGYADADIVFNAAGGFAGLEYSLKAIECGKTLALANKETLVCGGDIVMPLAAKYGVDVIPVDSEHSAIWQCLSYNRTAPVRRLIITASGGAFRHVSRQALKEVTPAQALNHPTWKMGKKITVDSATLMNKGYEVIEAHVLYSTPYDRIETVIQPKSIVHSMVEFEDGAILAQMSYPTMELPISLALSYPERLPTTVAPMDFTKAFSLDFEPMVRADYPCFDIALKCGQSGGIMPCVLNAADEVAVNAFLGGKIAFTDIFAVVDGTVQGFANEAVTDLKQLVETDLKARLAAQRIIDRLK